MLESRLFLTPGMKSANVTNKTSCYGVVLAMQWDITQVPEEEEEEEAGVAA
jgi:hypothetical protein